MVTFLVALQILNLDIFVQGDEQLTLLSVATSNADDDSDEIDSVVEYISAVVLRKIKTPANQNGNKPNKHLHGHKHVGMKMIDLQQVHYTASEDDFKEGSIFSFVKNYHYQFCKEITPPPPKA